MTALWVADRVLQPVSLSAATIAGGALLGFWISPSWRSGAVGLGFLSGILIGVGAHLNAHVSGRSTEPIEGLPTHLALDVGTGLSVALAILALCWIAERVLGQDRSGAGGSAPPGSSPPQSR